MNVLELSGVTSGYGRGNVVVDLSLVVPPSSIVAVVGPNGHGKTTLLRTISGLLKLRSGSITLGGDAIGNRSPHWIARHGLAHVPQGDLLFPLMTVRENLLMGAYSESRPEVIDQRLDAVHRLFPKLETLKRQTVRSLSGGERRMVGLGRGLMAGAQLMLIDEPSLGLAPLVIDQVYAAIATIKRDGKSILLVEENPERAASVSDYLYLMDNGSMKWHGDKAKFQEIGNQLISTYLGL